MAARQGGASHAGSSLIPGARRDLRDEATVAAAPGQVLHGWTSGQGARAIVGNSVDVSRASSWRGSLRRWSRCSCRASSSSRSVRTSGSPADLILPAEATPAEREAYIRRMGFDRPIPYQYAAFLRDALRGDCGDVAAHRRPAVELVSERLRRLASSWRPPPSRSTLVISIPLGVLSAVNRGGPWDRLGMGFAALGQSLPAFWLGIVLILFFAVWLRWLPTSGIGHWRHYVLPRVVLGWGISAGVVRLLRSSMLEVLDSEFVKLARTKGLRERRVVWKHALRNALIPVITFVGFMYGVIVAVRPSWSRSSSAGRGLAVSPTKSTLWRDFPVLQLAVTGLDDAGDRHQFPGRPELRAHRSAHPSMSGEMTVVDLGCGADAGRRPGAARRCAGCRGYRLAIVAVTAPGRGVRRRPDAARPARPSTRRRREAAGLRRRAASWRVPARHGPARARHPRAASSWARGVSLGVAAVGDRARRPGGHGPGVLAGYRGGWVDALIMRAADALPRLPRILIALVLGGHRRAELRRRGARCWGSSCGRASPASCAARCSTGRRATSSHSPG